MTDTRDYDISSMADQIDAHQAEIRELEATLAEREELLAVLLKGDDKTEPEILVGRIGAGEGILAYGLLVEGIVRHRACRPYAATLLTKYLGLES